MRRVIPAPDLSDGIAVSALLHGLLLVGIWFASRGAVMQLPDQINDTVEVDFLTIDQVTRIREAPKPSIEAAPRETTEGAQSAKIDAPKVVDKDGLPDPKAVPMPNSEGPSDRLDTRKLADLIDKSVVKDDKKRKRFDDLAKSLEKELPQQAVLSPAEAATLVQYMQARITQCFSMPSGAEKLDQMRVTLRITLDEQGAVVGIPSVTEEVGRTAENSGFFRAFSESTKRAILRCQPYNLPAASYAFWREQDITFNPRDLAR